MNRFVIVDGLPYLFARGKTYAVRWDEKGFTVGAEVKQASVPDVPVTYSEVSIKAKCVGHLNSIDVLRPEAPKQQEEENQEAHVQEDPDQAQPEEENQEAPDLDSMTIAQLKAYAETRGIDLGEAKKKADILAVIKGRENA